MPIKNTYQSVVHDGNVMKARLRAQTSAEMPTTRSRSGAVTWFEIMFVVCMRTTARALIVDIFLSCLLLPTQAV